jgi:hypothetical protein
LKAVNEAVEAPQGWLITDELDFSRFIPLHFARTPWTLAVQGKKNSAVALVELAV